jgi:hypothetical protein
MSLTPAQNIHDNNALAALTQRAGKTVTNAIQGASDKTGVNFAYLMEQAAAESGFKTDIKAKTSSATGLFQFIEKTWMSMVRDHGEKHGLGDFSKHIDTNGKVSDPALRDKILSLRKDPQIASIMAAEFADANKNFLQTNTELSSSDIGSTELYLAHFLGASGASSFINAYQDNPLTVAADIFPAASRANYNVFYDKTTGDARSLAQIYDFFDKKFETSNSFASSSQANGPSVFSKNGSYSYSRSLSSLDNITHPFLQHTHNDPSHSWSPSSILPHSQLISNPVEIITLSQLDLPSMNIDNEDDENARDKENRT